ncbi:MAG TPA: hypothetical protein VMT19_10025 [Thermoanaerobaculaceae bacterium]|nr:hypothetical protein [Thermoanaerobaculaceae bacterium]
MRDRHDEIARLLAAPVEPDPPEALRERALAAARAAWERPTDRWQALWESRPLRVAWSVTAVLLLVANVVVRVTSKPASRVAIRPAAPRAARGAGELQAIVTLPRIRAEYLGFGAAPPARPQKAPARQPRQGSEDKS